MSNEIVKTSHIKVEIGLNAEKTPVKIQWQAQDDPNVDGLQESKALMLSLFDKRTRDTLRIDLWTTEMQINEMDRFIYSNIKAMADTYFKATKNKELAEDMRRFVQYFGEKTEILPKSKD